MTRAMIERMRRKKRNRIQELSHVDTTAFGDLFLENEEKGRVKDNLLSLFERHISDTSHYLLSHRLSAINQNRKHRRSIFGNQIDGLKTTE